MRMTRANAVRFIVALGLISLLADVTYEGARSITGPFLGSLGASAAVVGIVAGLGELVGYTLRLLFGYAADRTPARDVMLSQAATLTGRGWGFGLHEAMDQIGAFLGPLVVAVTLAAS